MEAKDTVMNFKQMNLLRSTPAVAEAQAEISFPLGKQAGMQEVVEKVSNLVYEAGITQKLLDDTKNKRVGLDYQTQALRDALAEWQAFLKERGLEK